jgi:hypothetical protein
LYILYRSVPAVSFVAAAPCRHVANTDNEAGSPVSNNRSQGRAAMLNRV